MTFSISEALAQLAEAWKKAAPIGTKRTWKTGTYVKTAKGWERLKEPKTKPKAAAGGGAPSAKPAAPAKAPARPASAAGSAGSVTVQHSAPETSVNKEGNIYVTSEVRLGKHKFKAITTRLGPGHYTLELKDESGKNWSGNINVKNPAFATAKPRDFHTKLLKVIEPRMRRSLEANPDNTAAAGKAFRAAAPQK